MDCSDDQSGLPNYTLILFEARRWAVLQSHLPMMLIKLSLISM